MSYKITRKYFSVHIHFYKNDEREYVVLNDDPACLRIAISASKGIEGMDISKTMSVRRVVT